MINPNSIRQKRSSYSSHLFIFFLTLRCEAVCPHLHIQTPSPASISCSPSKPIKPRVCSVMMGLQLWFSGVEAASLHTDRQLAACFPSSLFIIWNQCRRLVHPWESGWFRPAKQIITSSCWQGGSSQHMKRRGGEPCVCLYLFVRTCVLEVQYSGWKINFTAPLKPITPVCDDKVYYYYDICKENYICYRSTRLLFLFFIPAFYITSSYTQLLRVYWGMLFSL